MFRPSRPMMRPFMSSDGSSTSVTVVSAAALAATRCRASATRFRARRFASPAASSSIWRTRPASSCRTCSSESCRIRAFASPVVIDEMRSSSFRSASLRAFNSSWSCFRCCSRSAIPWSRRVSSVSFREMSSSWASTRSSILTTASRRSRSSVSSSARSLIACSLVSMSASRRVASASRRASSSSRLRSRRAEARLEPDCRRSTSKVTPEPAASAISTATTSMDAPTGFRPHTAHSADRRSPARKLRTARSQLRSSGAVRPGGAGRIED